jgi:hypothetical protein
MGTLPSGDASITDTATLNLVNEAKTEWTNVLSNPSNAFTEFLNANVQVFYPTNGCGQAFISVDAPVPEPGTLVLFGTGSLLMGLGCARRLWARRRSS